MPYTLTMSLLWLVLAALSGVVVGYLFRGRTSVIATSHHPAAHDPAAHDRAAHDRAAHDPAGIAGSRPTDADELHRLQLRVERLDTQLSITTAERDKLRRLLDAVATVDATPDTRAAGDPESGEDATADPDAEGSHAPGDGIAVE